MTDIPFHLSVSGRRFYEHYVPKLVEQLERIADSLDKLVEAEESKPKPKSKQEKSK